MKQILIIFLAAISVIFGIQAQPKMSKVQLILVPNHSDALYSAGENVRVKVVALDCGMALNGVKIDYEVSEDLMTPHKCGTLTLKGNEGEIKAGTMKKPGFLRIKAAVEKDGKKYSSIITAGFDMDKLEPTVTKPADFDEFWSKNLESVRNRDLAPTMTLLPERSTPKVNVYKISYGNIRGSRMYGILTMPAKEGKYPAVLRFPGAGIYEIGGDIAHAAQGVIVLELGINGIPVDMESSVYDDLTRGALTEYYKLNIENKDKYYYKRVFLGCARGVDFLMSLPQCNGVIGTFGGSQGGALSIATSSLDSRIQATVAYFPALSDMEGYLHGRAGGWPHIFKNEADRTPANLETARYYDTANFARGLKAPVYFAFGYNDLTCAPTTTCSVYNVIPAPKQLIIGENIGHWTYPEQMAALWNWLIKELKSK